MNDVEKFRNKVKHIFGELLLEASTIPEFEQDIGYVMIAIGSAFGEFVFEEIIPNLRSPDDAPSISSHVLDAFNQGFNLEVKAQED